MVYLGKPSRGCLVCRKRKIKCDEALPGCSYCFKKRIVCPGYKSQFDIAWRDQNVVAEKSVQRRRRAAESKDVDRPIGRQLVTTPVIPGGISQDIESYAVSFFFSSYILLRRDPGAERGFLESLYPVWVNADSASPLMPAVAAVSLVMLEAWSQIPADLPMSLSRTRFNKAVISLRQNLMSNDDVSDDVLLAALMLDMFENLRTFFSKSASNLSPHIHGVIAFMHRRRQLALTNETSNGVIYGARSHIINRAMRDKQMVPSHLALWKTGALKDTGELLNDLNFEVANIQAVTSIGADTLENQLDLQRQILELDQRLLEWAANVPLDWTPVQVSSEACIPASVREAGLYQHHCDVHKSIVVANTFLSYYSSRIKLQVALIACSRTECIEASMENLQNLADTICACVPFYLGDRIRIGRIDDRTAQYPHLPGATVSDEHHAAASAYGGWMIAGRLAELLSPDIPLRAGQKQWIGGQLGRVRRVYAVQIAIEN